MNTKNSLYFSKIFVGGLSWDTDKGLFLSVFSLCRSVCFTRKYYRLLEWGVWLYQDLWPICVMIGGCRTSCDGTFSIKVGSIGYCNTHRL